jgi:hypothetical protein
MTRFSEGMRWTAYGRNGFADKNSLTLDDVTGEQQTGVVRTPQGEYLALSALTGNILCDAQDFEGAIKVAEAEALDPTRQ